MTAVHKKYCARDVHDGRPFIVSASLTDISLSTDWFLPLTRLPVPRQGARPTEHGSDRTRGRQTPRQQNIRPTEHEALTLLMVPMPLGVLM